MGGVLVECLAEAFLEGRLQEPPSVFLGLFGSDAGFVDCALDEGASKRAPPKRSRKVSVEELLPTVEDLAGALGAKLELSEASFDVEHL